ncbi:MAG: hypothetical protein ACXADB_02110 [Candidatus Hermodarchaeia archaeon]
MSNNCNSTLGVCISINPSSRSKKSASDSEKSEAQQNDQWRHDLRRKRDLQVTGKPKAPHSRNLEGLKQILRAEGFKFRGNRILIDREEATFEVDLKMGHVYALKEGKEPLVLCVTLESTPWANIDDLSDFDLFLLSIIYLLAREPLPQSIKEQLTD